MKRINRLLSCLGIVPLLSVLILSSCAGDEKVFDERPVGDSNQVTFSMTMPGKNALITQTTKAMGENDENNVQYIDVLLFNTTTKVFEGVGQCDASAIQSGPPGSSQKTFSVIITQGGTFDVVLLANARSLMGGSFTGMTKTEVLESLIVSVSGKWNAGGASSTPIPMWGERNNVQIRDASNVSNPIRMTRMLARIDVKIGSAAASVFQLTSVRVYNYNTHGSLAPQAAQWDAGAQKAIAPNVPYFSDLTKGPLLYTGNSEVSDTECVSEIYLFEAENHTGSTHSTGKALLDRTCLVIGGLYDGHGSETFYRVDFSEKKGGSRVFLDVLRNHLYTFSITKIAGAGYASAAEAFGAEPMNIEAEVLEWNSADLGNIFADGQYMLAVSQQKYEYISNAVTGTDANNQLIITTNYVNQEVSGASGWTATVWADEAGTIPVPNIDVIGTPWIKLSHASGTGHYPDGDPIHFKILENRSEAPRTAWVHVKAGRLTAKVEVKQHNQFYPPTHQGWAGSNIYWDEVKQRMTFDDINDQSHKNYGGLFFQWGSLWGISPVNAWSGAVMMYPPEGGSDIASYFGYHIWGTAPRVGDHTITSYPPSGKDDRDRNHLYELNGTQPGIGDICRHITEMSPGGRLHGKKWRMPTSNEFEAMGDYTWSSNGTSTPNVSGTGPIYSGQTKNNGVGTPFFPAAGYRTYSNGALDLMGEQGYYWAGSPSNTHGYYMLFNSSIVFLKFINHRAYGYPVRCVAEAED